RRALTHAVAHSQAVSIVHGRLIGSAFATAPTVSMTNSTNRVEIITFPAADHARGGGASRFVARGANENRRGAGWPADGDGHGLVGDGCIARTSTGRLSNCSQPRRQPSTRRPCFGAADQQCARVRGRSRPTRASCGSGTEPALVLLVDQFEELFGQGISDGE